MKYIECTGALPDDRMISFITTHHVMTLATVSSGGEPWCCSCFYAYDPVRNLFIFTSDETTRHGAEMTLSPRVAAAIALETRVTGRIRGIQITGTAKRVIETDHSWASGLYLTQFPIASLIKTMLWVLDPEHIKMTDNRLGFGKKLVWNR
jgi:uncharacterized protein